MAQLEAFAELVDRADVRIDLARACLLVAEDAYPGLDVDTYLAELERLGERLRTRLPVQARVEDKVVALNRFLFEELGYSGNAENYYDPRNSYLNEVIDRRTGIPITLSVIYMALGRRIGLPLQGVSFPGHFLVRMKVRGGVLVLDPFVDGAPLTEEDLRERLQRVIPAGATGGLSVAELPLEQFLEPASNRQILARLLRNLKSIFRDTDQPARLLEVLDRMLVVAPDASAELRDRGLVYQRLECHRAAMKDLTQYMEREPEAIDVPEIRARIVELAALCARLN
jgi:regulator of sirC expression with transglutaminase-like and TPR domain